MNYNKIGLLVFLLLILGFLVSLSNASDREIRSVNNITIYYYPETEALVDKALRLVQGGIRDLNIQLGFNQDLIVDLYIPRSRREFEKHLYGGRKKWSIAYALPPSTDEVGKIVIDPSSIDLYTNPLLSTLKHELLHLFLGDIERKSGHKVPLWFNEGLAQWVAGTPVFSDRSELRINALRSSLIPLEALRNRFPEAEPQVRLAYQQSESVVEFIAHNFGEKAIREIIRGLEQGKDFESALIDTLGLTTRQLEVRWQGKLKPFWPAVLTVLTSRNTLFIIMAILVIIGFLMLRHRSRRRLKEMAEEDEWMQSLPDGKAGLDDSEWSTGSPDRDIDTE